MGVVTKRVRVEKLEGQGKQGMSGSRAATHTDTRLLFILIGAVVSLTMAFCYLFSFILRIRELHRRDGERVMDLMGARLNEQQQHHHQRNHH
jgi:hypothetical protein